MIENLKKKKTKNEKLLTNKNKCLEIQYQSTENYKKNTNKLYTQTKYRRNAKALYMEVNCKYRKTFFFLYLYKEIFYENVVLESKLPFLLFLRR